MIFNKTKILHVAEYFAYFNNYLELSQRFTFFYLNSIIIRFIFLCEIKQPD